MVVIVSNVMGHHSQPLTLMESLSINVAARKKPVVSLTAPSVMVYEHT